MIEGLLANIRERYDFSDEEQALLQSMMGDKCEFAPGEVIVPEGKELCHSSLLLEGLACRSKYTKDGQRQIMEFDVPGDFVDLHSYPLERLDHSITALSRCQIITLPHDNITEMMDDYPRIGRILWFSTMVDASIHREWLVSLGQRRGLERTAHLFCEMWCRLNVVGLADGNAYELPCTQSELGEALGLTSVHINRVLRELRERGLVTFRSKRVEIHDRAALEEAAGFDPAYLYMGRRRK